MGFNPVPTIVERMPDVEVYQALLNVATDLGVDPMNMRYIPYHDRTHYEIKGNNKPIFDSILSHKSILVQTMAIYTELNFNVTCGRDEGKVTDVVTVSTKGDGAGAPKEDDYLRAIASVRRHFRPIDNKQVLSFLTDEQRQYMQLRDASLHTLERLQDEFFKRAQDTVTKLTTEHQQRQSAQDKQYEEKTKQLEAKAEEQKAQVEEAKKALEERIKALDLRDPTVVRRSIRKDLATVFTNRKAGLTVSSDTAKKRNNVMYGYLGFLGFLLVVMGVAFYSLPYDKDNPWLLIPRILPVVGIAVTAGFFIKWLGTIAKRHAEEEFKNQQYEIDFERAFFVVEWALEWTEKDKGEIPEFLIERISRGLFGSATEEEEATTAVDALASALLGSAASLKLKIGDNELNLDRKGLRNLLKKKATGQQEHE